MRLRTILLGLVLAFGLLPSNFALTVTGVVQTAQSAQRTNVLMTFTPLSGPSQSQPGVFTTSESVYTRSSTNAAWSIALKAGWYGMKVGSNPRDVAVLAVTNGSATVAYTDISTNLPLYVYPVAPWNLSSGSSTDYLPGSNVSFTTNVDGSITISATLTGGAASLRDITNVFANLSGPTQSNFISSVRLAGSNYVNQTAADATFQASTNYANTVASNRVAVVAGTGGVTVSSAANGTRQEFTINTPTNFATITASNIVQALQTQFAGTNAAAISNITVTLGTRTFLWATNGLTFTNILGLTPTNSSDTSIFVMPTLVNRPITWPSMRTPVFGGFFSTNAGGGGQLFPTFTNGIGYTVSITTYGTNAVWSCLAWPQ